MNKPLFAACLASLLALVAPAAFGGDVKLTQHDNRVSVNIDGKPFTDYIFGSTKEQPTVRPYLYPVLAADGTPVTFDQSLADKSDKKHSDHPHHRSLWVGHGDVNGADHWTLKEGEKQPKQRHLGFDKVEGHTILERLAWEGKDGNPVLNELRTIEFLQFPDGNRGIAFILAFTPVGGDVTLGDTKEAGLCSVRLAHSISDHPTITLATGATATNEKEEKAVWGKAADWCDESGEINGKPYGVAVLDDIDNPRHPSTWHVRAYGLLAANIFGLSDFDKKNPKHSGDFKIEAGKTVTFRYEVVVHEGDAKSANLEAKYKVYSQHGSAK